MLKKSGYRKQYQDLFVKLHPELIEGKTKLATKTITFVTTEACPLRCSYCYQCSKNHQAAMSKETAKAAIATILSEEKMNGYMTPEETPSVILDFIGGEPLLEVELMDYIIEEFRRQAFELDHPWAYNHMASISTNGIPIVHDPKVREFIEKYKERLSISITIDGDKALHDACRLYPDGSGSYDDVRKAIDIVRSVTELNDTKVTIAPGNVMYIAEAIMHLFGLGFTDIHANCVFEDVWKLEDAQELYRQMIKLADYMLESKIYETHECSLFDDFIGKPLAETETQNWCGGNGQMLAIGTDGRLFPCIRFMKYSYANADREEFEIGDVSRGIDSTEDNKYLQTLETITRQSQSTDECINCPVASGCAWCTGYNYDVFGTPNKRATFICDCHKARCLANYYYYTELYNRGEIQEQPVLNLPLKDIDRILGRSE